jgi:meckelin
MAFTDTSMAELSQQMRKEQEMQVSARGLVPSSTRQDLAENQCFELFITKELRMAYESKLLRRIEESAAMRGGGSMMGSAASAMGGGMRGGLGRGGYGGGMMAGLYKF